VRGYNLKILSILQDAIPTKSLFSIHGLAFHGWTPWLSFSVIRNTKKQAHLRVKEINRCGRIVVIHKLRRTRNYSLFPATDIFQDSSRHNILSISKQAYLSFPYTSRCYTELAAVMFLLRNPTASPMLVRPLVPRFSYYAFILKYFTMLYHLSRSFRVQQNGTHQVTIRQDVQSASVYLLITYSQEEQKLQNN
jgi:hypothetical protein